MPAPSISHRSARSWHKIIVTVDTRMTEAVAAFLTSISGTGVEITAPDKNYEAGNHEYPFEKVVTYVPTKPSGSEGDVTREDFKGLRHFLAQVNRIFPDCPVPHFITEIIAEEDWGKKWKSFFTSFHVTPSLVIKPTWETVDFQSKAELANPAVIEMDPGLAFGTGHHASTQMALMLLEELFQNGAGKLQKVLDVGTGSGILAMACGLFGARQILALDNDPDAVETARQNIFRNRLEDRIVASARDLTSLQSGFDLAVANITHDTLAELANSLKALIRPHGFLVLSGILKGIQEDSIRNIYEKRGMICLNVLTRDEWAALLLQKAV